MGVGIGRPSVAGELVRRSRGGRAGMASKLAGYTRMVVTYANGKSWGRDRPSMLIWVKNFPRVLRYLLCRKLSSLTRDGQNRWQGRFRM